MARLNLYLHICLDMSRSPSPNAKRNKMSKIQILSDLHLEAPKSYDLFEVKPVAPYLALLGDIGYVKDPEYFIFLEHQLSSFQTVFLLFGNHESYHSDWKTAKQKLQTFYQEMTAKKPSKILGTFIFLDQTRSDISPALTILGCTLYSHIPPERMDDVSFSLNDFYNIQDWTVEQHNEAHAADLAWLNAQVGSIAEREPERRIVIFTHHRPTVASGAVDPAHANSKISSGFASDLSAEVCWSTGNVGVWAFGHTHFNCDFVDEGSGKRVVTNQRGDYFQQSVGFDEGKCIEVR